MIGDTCRTARFRLIAAALLGAACLSAAALSTAGELAKPVFSDAELKAVVSHGPWPARDTKDATNRVSGKRDAIALGTRLFFDERLSPSGQVSCATCHVPERNWTDNMRRSVGVAEMHRNTPTIMNLRGSHWYGWDGAADSLWSQSLRPIVNERELAATPAYIAGLVRNDEQLACRYTKAFGAPPSPADNEAVFVDIGKALASFQETLVSGRTPFDNFRDAVARGDPPSKWTYSEPAQRGLKIFLGKGGCATCHSGPNFTSGEFFKTGLSRNAPSGKADPGRVEGVRELLASRFNLLGRYNDDPSGATASFTRAAATEKPEFGQFKVPSLRNLVLTTPYGRDGQIDSLADVVRYYSTVDPVRLHARDGKGGTPLDLTPREQADLVVFLESLSTFANPWRPDDGGACK